MLKKLLLVLLCFSFHLFPAAVHAQEQITLSAMQIDLWPEYDRPTMLVIYHATLPPNISLPATLTFRIPAVAGEPNAVAIRQVDGALFSVDYQRQVSGEWALITFTATTPQIQLEYYDPSLEKQDQQRHYEFQWPGDYAISSMTVQVQQPLGATNMRISPSMGSGRQGSNGLIYYTYQAGSVATGNRFTIAIDYQKAGDELSTSTLRVEPGEPITQDTTGRLDLMEILPWVLGVLGIVLIVGGGLWYWQSGRERAPSKRRQRRLSAAESAGKAAPGDAVYCHQCGKRAMPGDRFCRSCGTRLRTE